ncbi:uncharacterized protein [Prorops nasuta]|uniref:uncharacterized protein n=1 Tax=Prorops nasuta TaxID=863751 RepID=UPI0034D00A6E
MRKDYHCHLRYRSYNIKMKCFTFVFLLAITGNFIFIKIADALDDTLDDTCINGNAEEAIFFNNANIHEVPEHFIVSSHIKCLDLSFNPIQNIHEKTLSYLPSLTYLNLSSTHINLDNFFSETFLKLNLDNLETLVLDEVELNDRRLRLTIEKFPYIKRLFLRNNKIESVDTDSFIDTYNLVTLDLSYNQIGFLAAEVFDKLNALRYLYINNNQLAYIPNICKLVNLEILNLSGNGISTVLSNTFCGLTKLTILHLNHNKINCIKDNAFENLISLKVLDLSENIIHTLPENWIHPQNKLETLILQNNNFNSLNDIQLTNVESLKELYLYNNPFQIKGNLHVKSLIDLPPNITLHLELISYQQNNSKVRIYNSINIALVVCLCTTAYSLTSDLNATVPLDTFLSSIHQAYTASIKTPDRRLVKFLFINYLLFKSIHNISFIRYVYAYGLPLLVHTMVGIPNSHELTSLLTATEVIHIQLAEPLLGKMFLAFQVILHSEQSQNELNCFAMYKRIIYILIILSTLYWDSSYQQNNNNTGSILMHTTAYSLTLDINVIVLVFIHRAIYIQAYTTSIKSPKIRLNILEISFLIKTKRSMKNLKPLWLLVITTFFTLIKTNYALDNSLNDTCNEEGTVNLSRMKLEVINENFIISSYINCVDLSFNGIKTISEIAFNKSPNIIYLNLSNNPFSIKDFFVNIYNTLPSDSLRTLVLDEIRPTRDAFNFFIDHNVYNKLNLSNLYLQRNKIKKLPESWDQFGSKLKQLYLSNNLLTAVTSKDFPSSLVHLDLNSNRLYEVNITNLSDLEYLNISNNTKILHICSNDCNRFLSMKPPNEKKQITEAPTTTRALDFDNDCGRYIDSDYYNNDCYDNNQEYHTTTTASYDYIQEPVTDNDNNFFDSSNLFSLKHLNASNNKIVTLDTDAFIDNYNLVILDLSFNKLDFIADEVFKNLSVLKNLYISDNELAYIPHVCELSNLETLDLSENRISNVLSDAFCGLQKLETLYLNRNKINIVKDKAFENLISLRYLDLSENVLHFLPDNWMSPQSNLKVLLLQSNYFDSLSKIPLSDAELLTDLYLYNNTFKIMGNLFLKSLINLPQNLTLHLELMSVNAILTCYNLSLLIYQPFRRMVAKLISKRLFVSYTIILYPAIIVNSISGGRKSIFIHYYLLFKQYPSADSIFTFQVRFEVVMKSLLICLVFEAQRNMKFIVPFWLLVITTFYTCIKISNALETRLNDPCKNEGTVNLSRMHIEEINENFIISSYINCIDLSFNDIKTISEIAFNKLPNIIYLNLSNNPFSIKDFFVNIYNTLPSDSLRTLVLDEIRSTRDAFNFDLDISLNNRLNLSNLYLQRNSIKELPESWNQFGSGLKQLYLSNNLLTVLKLKDFPKSLTHLDLSSNRLYEVNINDLSQLEYLDISHNTKILHICSNDCTRFVSIKSVNEKYTTTTMDPRYDYYNNEYYYRRSYDRTTTASYDYIEEPVIENDNNFFNSLNLFSLKHLNASNNKIATLDTDAFIDNYNLVILDLSFNNLDFIADEVFKNLSVLANLYINDNRLPAIPHVCELINLKTLNLSGNHISNLLSDTFCGLQKLETLYLNRNKINIVKDKAFENLISLRYLDLSENVLHFLPDNWMSPQSNLKVLLLQSNYFDSLSKIPLSDAESLTDLCLFNNTFQLNGNLYLKSLINLPQNLTLHLELMAVNAIRT